MNVTAPNSVLIFLGAVRTNTVRTFTEPTVPTAFSEDLDWGYSTGVSHEVANALWTGSGATSNMDSTISSTSINKHAFAVSLTPPIYTIPLTYGSFTLSGIATLFSKVHYYLIEAVKGEFALTGFDITINKFWRMVSALGSYTLTGIAAGLTHVRTVGYQTGYFVLTSISATLGGFGSWKWRNKAKNNSTWTNKNKSI